MGIVDIKSPERPVPLAQVFMVALYSYLLHQILQKDVDVVRGDAGPLHQSCAAFRAFLTEGPHLDNALPIREAHVEDHHHPV